MNLLMAGSAAILFGLGTYLLLQRKLSRIIIGVGLLGHGANVLFINAGRRGDPPLIGQGDPSTFADPLPQALILTAIVIGFGVTALLLALAYRSWVLTDDDEVVDDVEDRSVARHGFINREEADEEELTSAFQVTRGPERPSPAASTPLDPDDADTHPGTGGGRS